MKGKDPKLDHIKTKTYAVKDPVEKMRRQATDCKEISVSYISDKEL